MGKDFFFFDCYTHISFSLILAGILRAGKTRFLDNQAACQMRSAKWLHSACAQRISLGFRGKTSAGLPRRVLYHVSIFYVNQTDSMLNFAQGQTSADDTCVY